MVSRAAESFGYGNVEQHVADDPVEEKRAAWRKTPAGNHPLISMTLNHNINMTT